jgi:hypothetical protein
VRLIISSGMMIIATKLGAARAGDGGRLLGLLPTALLLPQFAAILVISAVKVWRHT